MTVLHRLGTRLSGCVSAVARSPPLLGIAVGSWIALLSLFNAANPVTSFLVVAPATMLLWYGVLFALGRYRGVTNESGALDATTSESRAIGSETPGRFGTRNGDENPPDERAIRRLRNRYAEGDIDHEEFERRLDALVETEDVLTEGGSDDARARSVAREA